MTEKSSSIKAIDRTSIHRITSGQVVIDLQTAVKELVENSIDAGATSVEVRFKQYGLKSVEVIDNGSGIPEEDYDSVALKHHTSKLETFEDLSIVRTFGFRGEALSSLCALCEQLTVATATKETVPMGVSLEMGSNGHVKSRSTVAKPKGTTVTINSLFSPLPVRRKEFERNSKREFGKALALLHAFALGPCSAGPGVRLTVSNQLDKGQKSVQIRTNGTPSTRASVTALWGPKALDNIVDLNLAFSVDREKHTLRGQSQSQATETVFVEVKGLLSKFAVGCGRPGTDRQFLYVNGRPCNLSKVQKAFNEVYRTFNANQVPFILADFILPTESCDINLSPDKRTIFLHNEGNLISALKNALETHFATNRSTFDLGGTQAKAGTLNQSQLTQGAAAFKARGNTTSSQKTILITEKEDNDKEESAKSSPRKAKGETLTSSDDSSQLVSPNPTQTIPASPEVRRRSLPPSSPSALSQLHTSKVVDIEKEVHGPSPENMDLDHDGLDPNLIPVDSVPVPSPEPSKQSISLADGHGKDIEMVVSTSHTTWSQALKPSISRSLATSDVTMDELSSDVEDGPPRKKRKGQEATIPRQESKVADEMIQEGMVLSRERPLQRKETLIPPHKNPKAARECLRNRLASFACSGSQASVRLKPSDDGDDPDDDDALFSGSNVGGRLESREGSAKKPKSTGNLIELVEDEIAEDDDDDEPDPSSVLSQARLTTSSSPSLIPQDRVPHPEILKTTDSTSDVSLRFDTDKVVNVWRQIRDRSSQMMQGGSNKGKEALISSKVLVDAGVSNTENDDRAVDALARVIEKEDFASMDVVGQFNLGFIIARRRKDASPSPSRSISQELQVMDDLFIVDQHASDEKYNFETLQLTTRIQSQKLFRPQPLELTAADELLATENIEVLRQNGFEIEVDDSECSGQGSRLKLVAQPISKSTVFGMKDLEEIIHLMRDRPTGQMVRCSKARAMFAMRACRKSVMIGMPLNSHQMLTVLRHMGTIDQPWNCPHGRPTMRHLLDITTIDSTSIMQSAPIDWSAFQ